MRSPSPSLLLVRIYTLLEANRTQIEANSTQVEVKANLDVQRFHVIQKDHVRQSVLAAGFQRERDRYRTLEKFLKTFLTAKPSWMACGRNWRLKVPIEKKTDSLMYLGLMYLIPDMVTNEIRVNLSGINR